LDSQAKKSNVKALVAYRLAFAGLFGKSGASAQAQAKRTVI